MAVTFLTEVCLAAYALWHYKLNTVSRLVTTMLASLALFQLAEYFVCTGYGLQAEQWSRLGFVVIAALPPLGLHLMHALAGKTDRRLVYFSYATMAGFIGFFLTYHAAFAGHQCTGNYVIFQLADKVGGAYSIYYYTWLGLGISLGMRWANELKTRGREAVRQLRTVQALIAGYLVFLVPTALANTVRPETRAGIPSIMCGFAVILALILTLYILPRAPVPRKDSLPAKKPAL